VTLVWILGSGARARYSSSLAISGRYRLPAGGTPDLSQAFPSIFYFTYFTTHSGAIVAACLLVFGRRLLPRLWAVWRVSWSEG